jgi:hypothetical protein
MFPAPLSRLLRPLPRLAPCVLLALAAGCGKSPETPAGTPQAAATPPPALRFEPIGRPAGTDQPPWIAHVLAADLDRDSRMDVLACDAKDNTVTWLRQTAPGSFEEKVIAREMRGPVHVEAADLDRDGDIDVAVASMSVIFPNNDRIGTVFILENDGTQNFTPRIILENTSRVVDVRAADLNGDGRIDLALAQFGYDQGEVSWLEQAADGRFTRHVLLELSGAVNVEVADFNGDHQPDLVALLSQQWEEVHYFVNQGGGRFARQRLWGSTNEDYGSSGLTTGDLNRDGRIDIVFSNGDGFGPAATPGPRPWHGVQWLENTGDGFRYHRVGALPGAYSPRLVDFDGDGATDIVAVAAYADWNNQNRNVISLQWFRNDGRQSFEPVVLARAPKDLITLAVADFDGSGRPALVTGGFYIYPPFDGLSRLTLWRRGEGK